MMKVGVMEQSNGERWSGDQKCRLGCRMLKKEGYFFFLWIVRKRRTEKRNFEGNGESSISAKQDPTFSACRKLERERGGQCWRSGSLGCAVGGALGSGGDGPKRC